MKDNTSSNDKFDRDSSKKKKKKKKKMKIVLKLLCKIHNCSCHVHTSVSTKSCENIYQNFLKFFFAHQLLSTSTSMSLWEHFVVTGIL